MARKSRDDMCSRRRSVIVESRGGDHPVVPRSITLKSSSAPSYMANGTYFPLDHCRMSTNPSRSLLANFTLPWNNNSFGYLDYHDTVSPWKDELSMALIILWCENSALSPIEWLSAIARVHSPSYRYPLQVFFGSSWLISSQTSPALWEILFYHIITISVTVFPTILVSSSLLESANPTEKWLLAACSIWSEVQLSCVLFSHLNQALSYSCSIRKNYLSLWYPGRIQT